jgi:uncharacterized protein with beta-barrel porin domain
MLALLLTVAAILLAAWLSLSPKTTGKLRHREVMQTESGSTVAPASEPAAVTTAKGETTPVAEAVASEVLSEAPACALPAKKSRGIADLFGAVQESNLSKIREWVKSGNSVDTASEGSTLLHSAAVFGSVAVIELLIDELGATVDCRENSNLTPLHLAWCARISVARRFG